MSVVERGAGWECTRQLGGELGWQSYSSFLANVNIAANINYEHSFEAARDNKDTQESTSLTARVMAKGLLTPARLGGGRENHFSNRADVPRRPEPLALLDYASSRQTRGTRILQPLTPQVLATHAVAIATEAVMTEVPHQSPIERVMKASSRCQIRKTEVLRLSDRCSLAF